MSSTAGFPKPIARAVLGLFCLICLSGFAEENPVPESEPSTTIASRPVVVSCQAHPGCRIMMKEYELPGAISDMRIDPAGNLLAVLIEDSEKKKARFQIISLQKDRIVYSSLIPERSRIMTIKSGSFGLVGTDEIQFIDIGSGEVIKEIPGHYLYSPVNYPIENEIFLFDYKTGSISIWNLDSLSMIWKQDRIEEIPVEENVSSGRQRKRPKKTPSRFRLKQFQMWIVKDHVFLIINDELECRRVRDGHGWCYGVKTMEERFLGQILSGVFLGLFVPPFMQVPILFVSNDADYTAGLFSNPLIVDDKVLFASADYLSCLSLDTGDEIWKRQFHDQAGTARLLRLNGELGILIESGTFIKRGVLSETMNPYVSAFDIQSGEERWRFIPEALCPIREVLIWKNLCVLLTDGSLYILNEKGELLLNETLDPELLERKVDEQMSSRRFWGGRSEEELRKISSHSLFKPMVLVARDETLVLLCDTSLTAWDYSTLKKRWHREEIKMVRNVLSPDVSASWLLRIKGILHVDTYFASDSEHLWVVNEGGTMTAYNIHTGKIEHDFAMDYEKIRTYENYFLLSSENRIAVLQVESQFGKLLE